METDLFEFAYVPDWYGQLEELEGLVLPEPWKFKRPSAETKNQDTPILERYIHTIFRKQGIDFNSGKDEAEAARYFHVENECACFHTGLYTGWYKAVYGFFDRNKRRDSMLDWYFRGLWSNIFVTHMANKISFQVMKQSVPDKVFGIHYSCVGEHSCM